MNTNTFYLRNGKMPLIDDYPLINDTVATTTCEICGNSTENHFCMVKGMMFISIFVTCILGGIYLKYKVKEYKNKK